MQVTPVSCVELSKARDAVGVEDEERVLISDPMSSPLVGVEPCPCGEVFTTVVAKMQAFGWLAYLLVLGGDRCLFGNLAILAPEHWLSLGHLKPG